MKSLALALLLLALGCKNPVDDFPTLLSEGAIQMTPTALYLQLWQKMEACSGLSGDFAAVTWYHTPRIEARGVDYAGAWLSRENAIFIVDGRLDNLSVIEHEETHALLQGGMDHPVQYFNGVCGDLLVVTDNPA